MCTVYPVLACVVCYNTVPIIYLLNLQAAKAGPGLKGISYSSAETPAAFDFSDPPAPLSVPNDPTPSPPVTPTSVMNNSDASPMPSALAPSEPRQQEGASNSSDLSNLFEGLFDNPKAESAPGKSSSQPSPDQSLQVTIIERIIVTKQSMLDTPASSLSIRWQFWQLLGLSNLSAGIAANNLGAESFEAPA